MHRKVDFLAEGLDQEDEGEVSYAVDESLTSGPGVYYDVFYIQITEEAKEDWGYME